MLLHAWQLPGLAPTRYWSVPQTVFEMLTQLKPLVVPLQLPSRRMPVSQVPLLHAWQLPGLAPTRYWSMPQTAFGMSTQLKPSSVPLQTPSRRFPAPQMALLQTVQVPAAVVDAPDRY